jgi:hypothetical protein
MDVVTGLCHDLPVITTNPIFIGVFRAGDRMELADPEFSNGSIMGDVFPMVDVKCKCER